MFATVFGVPFNKVKARFLILWKNEFWNYSRSTVYPFMTANLWLAEGQSTTQSWLVIKPLCARTGCSGLDYPSSVTAELCRPSPVLNVKCEIAVIAKCLTVLYTLRRFCPRKQAIWLNSISNTSTRKPSWSKGDARQQCVYKDPWQIILRSSILPVDFLLVVNIIRGRILVIVLRHIFLRKEAENRYYGNSDEKTAVYPFKVIQGYWFWD